MIVRKSRFAMLRNSIQTSVRIFCSVTLFALRFLLSAAHFQWRLDPVSKCIIDKRFFFFLFAADPRVLTAEFDFEAGKKSLLILSLEIQIQI